METTKEIDSDIVHAIIKKNKTKILGDGIINGVNSAKLPRLT